MAGNTQPKKKIVSDATFFGEYLHAKYQRYWNILSRETDDQRNLQPDWTRVFWPITRRTFPDIGFAQ